MGKAKVSPKGQVVIPKPLRDKYGIKEGEEVLVEESKRGILVMKKEENPLKAMVGLFEGKMSKSSTELVREIREESEARIERAKKAVR
ncbi:AbrB/MazE/SpoVT family DNA-binding domain-containing protein [Nitrososphaera sp.]|uniref:AbrB/MazE/SpoVT family DNA-binding domain-containing protein n=1 Tax=Nitrososphaera sp. TaxID=1971748 RepID=UPI0017D90D40|nr:AbrB/MazE/SpoVT family DNA-binding domain-containing protein [Nitrososphaera sp.]NWG36573.1 AbrB/MazE/SpoVT family DNA-binding domain-containing protein [Nitrososphaera sp.]